MVYIGLLTGKENIMKYLLLNCYGVVIDFTYDGLVAAYWFDCGLDVEVLNLERIG